ncbi:MAG: hypothetical protein LUD27_06675 [Clostridia bacterium]|nr:hypothetical protein [Clostridia bacterium]
MVITTIITALISSVVGAIVGAVAAGVKSKTKKELNAEKAERLGVQCLLRTQLLDFHDKYTARKYCPSYAKEAIMNEYEAYHGLGGNGLVTKFYNDIMALPETQPDEKQEKTTE